MSFLDKLTTLLPIGKKEEKREYFFAVNIGIEDLSVALWIIEGKELKILETASSSYSSNDEIAQVLDRILDEVIGPIEVDPHKILFGVPSSWVLDDNLKDEYLKVLRTVVKELELTPLAYVVTSNALIHFLEKQEGIPATAILVGFEKHNLTVTVVRAGKLDGVKTVKRSDSAGADIEKALLQLTDVETLPSKILIYGLYGSELKSQLLSFSWMAKLSFLHFPKIDVLDEEIPIKSVCLAGGSEINEDIVYKEETTKKKRERTKIMEEEILGKEEKEEKEEETDEPKESDTTSSKIEDGDNLGFVVGDIAQHNRDRAILDESEAAEEELPQETYLQEDENQKEQNLVPQESNIEVDDFEGQTPALPADGHRVKSVKKLIPKKFIPMVFLLLILGLGTILLGAYLFLSKAQVKVFVEPKILEKDATVVADPNQKTVNEADKIIPAQIVEVEVSGSAKDTASGKRQIGDPAKGTIVLYNKTSESQTLSKGTQINSSGGLKFTLDTNAVIASQSASDSGITFGKANANVTASVIGADGNLPSGSTFTVAGFSTDKVSAKSEGNFSGGTSKDVTVVSSEDAQRLLAKLSSDLKQQAQAKLQEKYPSKKILQEALAENIIKKSYNKNINDQAAEFLLNMTVYYKGTAFNDADLKTIVSKLVDTQVPTGFMLDITGTETQADVSKLEKNGKLIFLAKFKAKLLPKIDTDKIRNAIKFKTKEEAENVIKGMENILGSEIKITPNLPSALARLPFFVKNITLDVGLK